MLLCMAKTRKDILSQVTNVHNEPQLRAKLDSYQKQVKTKPSILTRNRFRPDNTGSRPKAHPIWSNVTFNITF